MDFPQFFRTAITQSTILSNRWRGLALLCKPSDLYRSARGTVNEDQVMPARGTEFSDRDVGLHVIIKPMTVISVSVTGNIIPAKPGIRYLIHSVQLTIRQLVTDDNTTASISTTSVGATTSLCMLAPVPLTAGTYTTSCTPDALCDVNKGVTLATTTANFAGISASISYTEVGAS